MPLGYLISALVTLLVVVDPIGLAPTFIGITEGMSAKLRHRVALRAAVIAGLILIGSALIGNWLLDRLAISLSAFRIAGGLLLFSIATEMVFGVRMRREGEAAEQAIEERAHNIAAFPLAIPLMAGPGAITATVLLAGRADGNLLLLAILFAVVVCCGILLGRVPAGRADRALPWRDRQHRALAPARRAACGIGGSVRGRRHPRDPHGLTKLSASARA
jgi:multiple antibiotic resistance protein